MDQSNKIEKGKKVETDGLTKKERRALKVAATSENKGTPIKSENQSDSQHKKSQETQKSDKVKKEQPNLNKKENCKVLNEIVKTQVENGPTKAELKAQRRAVQEQQRLAKANQKVEEEKKHVPKTEQTPKEYKSKIADKALSPKKEVIKSINKHKVPLFNHLYFESIESVSIKNSTININTVHAAFLKLGAQYYSKTILGSNARCLALLSALKNLILDFTTPSKQEFCRSLESTLQACVSHLNNCRPLAVSMTNALRHFKLHLTQIDTNLSDNDKKAKLLDCVETYIFDEINKAGEAISMQVRGKIVNEDVILTYGCSSLITRILLDAFHEGKKFKVIIVDARPLLEGREMLRKLVCAGIPCTYVLINAASFVMGRVSKVLLGAHALLANGYVMSRTGTAQVALIANSYKKPVLVCCETYKFCERVQTDSFVYNEIGDPNQLVTVDTVEEKSPLASWQNSNYLTPLNLLYDVTPPDLVTAVVTELAFLPCTSVPVILRIRPTEVIT